MAWDDMIIIRRWSPGLLSLIVVVVIALAVLGHLAAPWPPQNATWASAQHRLECRGGTFVLDGRVVPLSDSGPSYLEFYDATGFYVRIHRNGKYWYRPAVGGGPWQPDAPGGWSRIANESGK